MVCFVWPVRWTASVSWGWTMWALWRSSSTPRSMFVWCVRARNPPHRLTLSPHSLPPSAQHHFSHHPPFLTGLSPQPRVPNDWSRPNQSRRYLQQTVLQLLPLSTSQSPGHWSPWQDWPCGVVNRLWLNWRKETEVWDSASWTIRSVELQFYSVCVLAWLS